ncbi:SusC/RagA family TonB-linked outer membrane protein [Labilibacter marinus]|uniref:SusC/RagA family TonB-linked outer membrane protein n=1 Tax=Labilibacter marinus TaxID=1477105 RepID=UPI00130126A9|nr:TonB-dependent receptor [Labilibacter marinus]
MMRLMSSRSRMRHYVLTILCAIMFFAVEMHAQEILVTGVISSSEDGMPIPGVSVVIKGTTVGTISDFDGNYSIKAENGQTLLFSFVGMKNQEVVISGKKIDVKMENDFIGLDEVVAIGYGVQKKKEVTGAVTQVKSEQISKHVTPDLATALQGQVAGVNVVAASGEPGAAASIQIRGVTSIGGSNTPLFVVDGIPQDGDPRLSSNEIETIDILKDAASCAVYGTRGAAGVILITTKRGEAGELRVSVDGMYGIQHITSGTPKMTTEEQMYYEAIEARYAEPQYPTDIASRNPSWLTNETSIIDLVQNDNAVTQNYNVTFSGGSKNLTTSAVFGYYNQEGVIINSHFERFNGRINSRFHKNRLTVNTSINFSIEDRQKPVGNLLTQAYRFLPYYPDVDSDTEAVEATGGDRTKMDYVLQAIKKEDYNKRDRLNANVNLDYELAKGLKFFTKIGAGITNNNGKTFVPAYAVIDDGVAEIDPTKSYSGMSTDRATLFSAEAALNYVKKINNHKITALVNFSAEERTYDNVYGRKEGITNNNIKVINGGTINPTIYSGNNYKSTLLGTLGRLQYDYKGRYLFSASARRDGSSKFSEKNRWGLFPSVSAGWNVADENFWQPVADVVNGFKVRASYGTTGNERIGNYLYSSVLSQNVDYAYSNGSMDMLALGTAQKTYANTDVQWETSKQFNVGIDLGFFQNKLTFNADYYQTKKEDMLFPVKLPASAGALRKSAANVILNVGDMSNQGMELSMLYRNQIGKWKWSLGGTFSKNENEITQMSGNSTVIVNSNSALISGDGASTVTAIMLGREAGAFFLNPTNGVIKTEEQLVEYQKLNPTAKMGDLMYVDTNKDGSISSEDREYSGSGLPDYELGLNMTVDYQGFDFSMQWYAAIGGDIMNGSKAAAYSYETHPDLMYMWTTANDHSDIPIYRGDSKSHDNYRGYTDFWLEDGSYVRLRNITLGYTVPKTMISNIGISNCRVYVTAQNPLTFTNYEGYDPEVGGNISNRGVDKGNYPVSSSYSVGVKLDF